MAKPSEHQSIYFLAVNQCSAVMPSCEESAAHVVCQREQKKKKVPNIDETRLENEHPHEKPQSSAVKYSS